jgi:hypothetical protein
MVTKYWSYQGGKQRLDEIDMTDSVTELLSQLYVLKDGPAKSVASELGWTKSQRVIGSFDWKYDAYKNGVAIEFERGNQTKARWAWMKFQLGVGENTGFAEFAKLTEVEVGILLLAEEQGGAALDRCRNEVKSDVFDKLLDVDIPMIIAEFSETEESGQFK